ncbi:hypothetical protein MH928_13590 [Flavobacterium sp. WW92]|uniref:hypothetical protein n=1 Tax=unclassified Flavobacterium TaxID=196869 RepID=UPI0022241ED6|nr:MULTISPECIES: hypothetical protein [unclassified Flavobacterium]WDO12353.1 hypothetical protein MH928_13590 [Flavobacterium sp. WW92]
MWNSFNTYDLSPEDAFETMNNQLFERYLYRNYSDELINFRVINGSGGDGGIEAYGVLNDNSILAVQSKWFRNNLEELQINQIRKSVHTAMGLRPNIKKYIICIPRNINSLKIGKGRKPIKDSEEFRINNLTRDLCKDYPDLDITWWFDHELGIEIQKPENEGVHKYWFEREIFFFKTLSERFQMQKTNSWLKERYVPNLNSSGIIQMQVSKQTFSEPFRKKVFSTATKLHKEISEFELLLDPLVRYSVNRNYYNIILNISASLKYVLAYLDQIKMMALKALEGNLDLSFYSQEIYETVGELRESLKENIPTNLEKPTYDKLVLQLDVLQSDLLYGFERLCEELRTVPCCIIYGRAGTGKTHGLAFGVEESLNAGAPAILIRAYGSDSKSWESLLSSELGLHSWNLSEMLSALETLAHRNDVRKSNQNEVGIEPEFELSKVLICIDGLEEDIANWDNWYDRISEVEEISRRFPRLRFLFTARDYFYDNSKVSENGWLKELTLPREGDVAIFEVLPKYLDEYSISIPNLDSFRGLDSLFALRLFCEEYKGKTITEVDSVETATGTLLNLKLSRLNEEFLQLVRKKSLDVHPVTDALLLISEMFYSAPEMSHRFIKEGITPDLQHYLDNSEIEHLLQFLSENGIMTRFERSQSRGMIKKYEKHYSITYQSILEIVISDNITEAIVNGGLEEFPDIVFQNFALPVDMNPIEFQRKYNKAPNQQLIQNVVNSIFLRTEKLIGWDGYLQKGFTEQEIFGMQLEALATAPYELAKKFEKWISEILKDDYGKRFTILKSLIYPLANRTDTPFNALYLHGILYNIPDAFSRDKFWSGLDSYEKSVCKPKSSWSLNSVLNVYRRLDEFEKHDGRPLMYAWGLSTLDQKLRENLRTKLAEWAVMVPYEFIKLLDKLFDCNDPQIQEDLAAVMLGVSSRCKDKPAIAVLATWSVKNIFENKIIHRNVIVRYGFNAIVEKAFQLRLIDKAEVAKARPSKLEEFVYLPLEQRYLENPREEFYPIVHDLAWYVIRDAYDKFLTYEIGYGKEGMTKETEVFIRKYESHHSNEFEIGCREWAMAAALAYIRALGLDRIKGNGYTDASHGSKSEKFTYEEKYTWLAVNFLKGYLADYLPYTDYDDKYWIKDYSVITEIHNPGEDFDNDFESRVDTFFNPAKWLISDVLAPELSDGKDIAGSIQAAVDNEPTINFADWIYYNRSDFDFLKEGQRGSALYNYTALYNSTKTIQSSIEVHCCLIKENDFEAFREDLSKSFNEKILRDDLQFYASPRTDIYSNPSDIVWMDWIAEDGGRRHFNDSITFDVSLAKIVRKNVEGEEEVYLPSKKARKALGIVALEGSSYLDKKNSIVGVSHKVKTDVFGESQNILIVDDSIWTSNLKKKGLVRFWFAMTIINKNSINDSIKSVPFCQKVRKYLIWEENGKLKAVKFWDKMFSNE